MYNNNQYIESVKVQKMNSLMLYISVAFQLVVATYNQTYIVRSNDSNFSVCDHQNLLPNDGCDTLTNFVRNSNMYLVPDSVHFVFLSGIHYLENNTSLQVSNKMYLDLSGSAVQTPVIHCLGDGGFNLINISHLTLESLILSECGSYFDGLYSTRAAVRISNVWDLSLLFITVQKSHGYGLSIYQLYGESNISYCTFQNNSGAVDYIGGNAEVFFPCQTNNSNTGSIFTLDSTQFLYGNFGKKDSDQTASGLVVRLCSSVFLNMNNVTMDGNYAVWYSNFSNFSGSGGNLALIFSNKVKHVNSTIVIQNSHFINGTAGFGGALFVNSSSISSLHFFNCIFKNNHALLDGGAVYYQVTHWNSHHTIAQSSAHSDFMNCNFSQNFVNSTQDTGVGIAVSIVNFYISQRFSKFMMLKVHFTNCDFTSNYLLANKEKLFSSTSGILFVSEQLGETLIADCLFSDNEASAISAIHTFITFSGMVTILNNTAIIGGGVILCAASFIVLRQNTTLVIQNNKASQFGGGIYVESVFSQSHPLCFFQFDVECPELSFNNETINTTRVDLINNTAAAGSQLYGGNVDHCYTALQGTTVVFDHFFHVESNSSDSSQITSDAQTVCLCQSKQTYNCSLENKVMQIGPVYSGTDFSVYVAITGQREGLTQGSISISNHNNCSFVHHKYIQDASSCTELSYKVYSLRDEEILTLTAVSQYNTLMRGINAKYLHVQIKKCPLGFGATHANPACCCLPILEQHGVKCSIDHQTVLRIPPVWIGYHFANQSSISGTTDGIIYHNKCLEDYCLSEQVEIHTSVTTFGENMQCAYNRSGLLCGTCEHDLTSVVGSSACKDCSTYSLSVAISLTLAIALGGILLVAVLFICNFTVTEGTMSGLIFYANIFAFISPTLLTNINFPFVTTIVIVFLSWLNLDPGIEFCFYHSLNEYQKMWGHFIFPVYLWAIMGCIIILCQKYPWAARVAGKNAVPVLATIFLLSYAKINQGVMYALSYTTVEYPAPNDSTIVVTVWMMDATVTYLAGKHIPLFVAGVIFGMLSVTYTTLILCIRPLQKASHFKCFLWVNKLKPMIDAYSCPHIIDEQNQLWNGLLLLTRGIIWAIFTLRGGDHPMLILALIIICCSGLYALSWSLGGIYKKSHLNILCSSYLLNLAAVSTITLYFHARDFGSRDGDRDTYIAICSSVSVFIAMATFVGIALLHSYKLSKRINVVEKLSNCMSKHLRVQILRCPSGYMRLPDQFSSANSEDEFTCTDLPEFDYREPQLADLDNNTT